jgi:membrane protease YdiL (CAAX protease family)
VLAEVLGVAVVLAGMVALSVRGSTDEYDWATFRRSGRRLWLVVAGVLVWLFAAEGADLGSLNHPPVGEFLPSAALAFVGIGATGIVTGLAMQKWVDGPPDPSTRGLLELPKRRALPLVVATGVAEEVIFRGYVLTRVASLTGSDLAAIAVSAVAFAVVRAADRNRAQGAQMAALGVTLAASFAYTGNLLAVIVARVGYDALTTLSADPDDLPNE